MKIEDEDILSNDILGSHGKRRLDFPLNHTDVEERRKQFNERLQMLFDGNHINARAYHNAKIRLQFHGIRIAGPPNTNDVLPHARLFDDRLVDAATQKRELAINS